MSNGKRVWAAKVFLSHLFTLDDVSFSPWLFVVWPNHILKMWLDIGRRYSEMLCIIVSYLLTDNELGLWLWHRIWRKISSTQKRRINHGKRFTCLAGFFALFFFSIGFDKNTDSLVVCDLCKPVQFSEKVESKKLTTIENPKGERHKVQSSFIAQCVLCCHVTTIFFLFSVLLSMKLEAFKILFLRRSQIRIGRFGSLLDRERAWHRQKSNNKNIKLRWMAGVHHLISRP